MTTQSWDDDDRLLDELRTAIRQAGSPTPTMTAAGQAAFSWRTIDAELAALTHDSLRDEREAVRAAAAPTRNLIFTGKVLSVELEQTPTSLIGQLIPPTSGEVTLVAPSGEVAGASADELGCFDVERPRSGLVRLRCRTPSGVMLTDWFRL